MPPGLAPGVVLASGDAIAIRRVRLWLVARLRGTGSSIFAETVSGNGVAQSPAVGLFGPPGGDTLSTPFVSPLLPSDTRVFSVIVYCSADAGVGCTPAETNILDIKGAEATLEEGRPPTATIDGGELLTRGTQSGVRGLTFTAADQESGITRISALVGNTVVGTADYLADCAFAGLAACPPGRTGVISADTRKVPDGIYTVGLRVTDAAGNEATVQSPTAIQVMNGAQAAPAPTSGAAVPPSVRLAASFAANKRPKLTVDYGRRVVIRGRLLTDDGQPIAGGRVELLASLTSGVAGSRSDGASTGVDGVFDYIVPRGPSRTLTLTYRSQGSDAKTATVVLKLRVRAAADLRVALHGVQVRYRGRVLSGPLPARGKRVEIQGRAPGAAWKTFAVRRTTRRGVFAGTYRLRVHRPGVRLQFRVRVPAEAGYGYVGHTSAAVSRIVR